LRQGGESKLKSMTDLGALCDYIERNADRIYVREQVDGKWGSYALTSLPAPLAVSHALRLVRESRTPAADLGELQRKQ